MDLTGFCRFTVGLDPLMGQLAVHTKLLFSRVTVTRRLLQGVQCTGSMLSCNLALVYQYALLLLIRGLHGSLSAVPEFHV